MNLLTKPNYQIRQNYDLLSQSLLQIMTHSNRSWHGDTERRVRVDNTAASY
jgi:hypothetical protein